MAPKLRDHTLSATQRIALTAVLQAERSLAQQMTATQTSKVEIFADIEKHFRLAAGALGTTHEIEADGDDWKVYAVADRNGKVTA